MSFLFSIHNTLFPTLSPFCYQIGLWEDVIEKPRKSCSVFRVPCPCRACEVVVAKFASSVRVCSGSVSSCCCSCCCITSSRPHMLPGGTTRFADFTFRSLGFETFLCFSLPLKRCLSAPIRADSSLVLRFAVLRQRAVPLRSPSNSTRASS